MLAILVKMMNEGISIFIKGFYPAESQMPNFLVNIYKVMKSPIIGTTFLSYSIYFIYICSNYYKSSSLDFLFFTG